MKKLLVALLLLSCLPAVGSEAETEVTEKLESAVKAYREVLVACSKLTTELASVSEHEIEWYLNDACAEAIQQHKIAGMQFIKAQEQRITSEGLSITNEGATSRLTQFRAAFRFTEQDESTDDKE